MSGYILMGVVVIIAIVIAVVLFITNDGDDNTDGGLDPHNGE